MEDLILLPQKALRKLDYLFMHNDILHKNKDTLYPMVIEWAKEMIKESHQEWADIHATTIETIIKNDRRSEAKQRALIKNQKYNEFRKCFYDIQKREFLNHQGNLKPSFFVNWFMRTQVELEIPYVKSNQKRKLTSLAIENNKKFSYLLQAEVS